MSVIEHKAEAPKHVTCKVITVSDTRTKDTDKSGQAIIDFLVKAGHQVLDYVIVRDEQALIYSEIIKGCENDVIDIVLTNGGTGISKRDVTIETVQQIIEKEIIGFGELFRMLSYTEDIGSAAIMSRAIAGISLSTGIFAMPGSTGAVKLAMEKLILPEIAHVVREIKK